MLQADDAVTGHRNRLSRYLGIALAYMDSDVLVHAGDDFWFIIAVIDDSFVQTAVARRTIDRQIFDPKRIEDIDHEVPAARRLIRWVIRRRHGLGSRLQQAWNCSLQPFLGSSRDNLGSGRRDNRGGRADNASSFEEIAAIGIGGMAAFRHESSLGWQDMPTGRQLNWLIKFSPSCRFRQARFEQDFSTSSDG